MYIKQFISGMDVFPVSRNGTGYGIWLGERFKQSPSVGDGSELADFPVRAPNFSETLTFPAHFRNSINPADFTFG